MRKLVLLGAICFTASTLASVADAQQNRDIPKGAEGETRVDSFAEEGSSVSPVGRIVRSLDLDRSGDISAEELQTALAAIKAADVDGDGAISKDELKKVVRRRQRDDREPVASNKVQNRDDPRHIWAVQLITKHDRNGDGKLSEAEMPFAYRSAFEEMDMNNDRGIDFSELKRRMEQSSGRIRSLRKNGKEELEPGTEQQEAAPSIGGRAGARATRKN
ncbi:MAG: EF-hand domain-containing protein [Planctomycetota bacterium]